MTFWSRMSAAIRAFREGSVTSDVQPGQATAWNDPGGRALRYALYWSFFENTAYRNVHRWTTKMRADYGLYAHTRSIYSPAYRLAEFWVSHLLGGPLDPSAGGSVASGSAIPIELGANVQARQGKALRQAIATLWQSSNWAVQKDIWTRYGSVMGDVGLKIVDDPLRRMVRLEIVHPASLIWVDRDPQHFVKAYILEEERLDPRPAPLRSHDQPTPQLVTYREIAQRDGNNVVYQTYLNGAPFAWNGITPEWAEPYGFVPLVTTQHLNVGMDWGWSELHAGRPKIQELDDIASKFDDQIRKTVDAPWLFAGVAQPATTPSLTRSGVAPDVASAYTEAEKAKGRQELPALYATDPQAHAQALIAPLDLPGVLAQIESLIKEIERDYPELALDVIARDASDASGRALRVAREPVETKVVARRAPYDSDLVRAHQMAIAIGGFRGYTGYEGFGLDSYAAGRLDHTIAPRPVFAIDPNDELDTQQKFWMVGAAAEKSGMPIEMYLEEAGWDAAKIARVTAERDRRARLAAVVAPPVPTPAPAPGTNQ